MPETVKLYNPNDGVTGRPNGTYLDLEEAKAREVRSAKAEKRKPDFENLLSVGIPLHTEEQLRDRGYAPEVDIQEGSVSDKAEKHFEEGEVTKVEVDTDKEFRTSSAKEEKEFLKQGEDNRLNQGNESEKSDKTDGTDTNAGTKSAGNKK